jgi:hypothetical protein
MSIIFAGMKKITATQNSAAPKIAKTTFSVESEGCISVCSHKGPEFRARYFCPTKAMWL